MIWNSYVPHYLVYGSSKIISWDQNLVIDVVNESYNESHNIFCGVHLSWECY